MSKKPQALGTVWIAGAKVLDRNGKSIGGCMDTPNAIAKMFMEVPKANAVKTMFGLKTRAEYMDRMGNFNNAQSCFHAA